MRVVCTLPSGCIINVPNEDACVVSFGSNDIDDKFWEKALKNPAVKAWLGEGGFLKAGSSAPDVEPEEAEEEGEFLSLSNLTVDGASEVIEVEDDEDALKFWMENDSRKGVHKAIESRLEELAEL